MSKFTDIYDDDVIKKFAPRDTKDIRDEMEEFIEERRQLYIKWGEDNDVNIYFEAGDRTIEIDTIFFNVWFDKESDAMAFKLAWS